jgi:hypothetical protein
MEGNYSQTEHVLGHTKFIFCLSDFLHAKKLGTFFFQDAGGLCFIIFFAHMLKTQYQIRKWLGARW